MIRSPRNVSPLPVCARLLALSTLLLLISLPLDGARAQTLLRGDANGDGTTTISDPQFILNFLFLGGPAPSCVPIADANFDRTANISDAQFILQFLFLGGPGPEPLTAPEITTCGGVDPELIARGREVYETPDPDGLPFSCSTCHSILPAVDDPFLHPGSTLHDAARRPSYKLGALDRLIEAANTCRVGWMRATPWVDDDADWLALEAFLESIAPPDAAPPVVYTITPPSTVGPATGDADRGCELFHRSCVTCHGDGASGTELAPGLFDVPFEPDFVRAKIRLSGPIDTIYDGLVEGFMPFWSAEVLSDSMVEDLTAYVTGRPVATCAGEE